MRLEGLTDCVDDIVGCTNMGCPYWLRTHWFIVLVGATYCVGTVVVLWCWLCWWCWTCCEVYGEGTGSVYWWIHTINYNHHHRVKVLTSFSSRDFRHFDVQHAYVWWHKKQSQFQSKSNGNGMQFTYRLGARDWETVRHGHSCDDHHHEQ